MTLRLSLQSESNNAYDALHEKLLMVRAADSVVKV